MNAISNAEREAHCLSSLMKSERDVYSATSAGLTQNYFTTPEHRAIYAAIQSSAANGVAPEAHALWPFLSSLHGQQVTLVHLTGIEGLEPTAINSPRLVADIIGLAKQRSLNAALSAAQEATAGDAASWDELWDRVAPHLRAALDCAAQHQSLTLADFAEEARSAIVSPSDAGLEGPFPGWDRATGKMKPGELCILAGRPGLGKTALALQYASTAAQHGKNVAFFSLEMSGAELANRLAVQRAGRAGLADRKALLAGLDQIKALRPLHVFESRSVSKIDQIEARCRLLLTAPGGLGLVVVDYLQLITPPQEIRREHRERQVAEMSRQFKLMAQSLGCPILLLSQLNRESEREDRPPRLSDLRESGAIEQDADKVWLLYAPPPGSDQPQDSQAERIHVQLVQAKARNGAPWVVGHLIFDRPCVTFSPK